MSIEEFAVVRFEPCPAFRADGTGAAVCADCGWLDHEHPVEAEVRVLHAPARASADARRLAS